jgi:CDP-diacylglycerol--glycerol-3-phosphate 3-phosphatidyltransferase
MHSRDHLHRDAKWTVPNVLTALRIIMAMYAAALFMAQSQEKLAVILCVIAALLDAFDGWYARTFSQCSKLGKHLDPLADKLLMAVVYALIAVKMNSLAVWILVGLIAVREIGLTLFRAYSLRRYKTFIPANRWGKVKMILQSTVGIVLIAYAYFWNGGFHFHLTVVVGPLFVILLISYYSAIIYTKSWRDTITNDAGERGVDAAEATGDSREADRMVVGG